MNIGPIQQDGLVQPALPAVEQPVAGTSFDAIAGNLTKLDETLKTADASLQAYAAGADVPVHEVMINMEKARITLQLAVEVRNHVVDAYQEFMRMQL